MEAGGAGGGAGGGVFSGFVLMVVPSLCWACRGVFMLRVAVGCGFNFAYCIDCVLFLLACLLGVSIERFGVLSAVSTLCRLG